MHRHSTAMLIAATVFIVAGYIVLFYGNGKPQASCSELGGTCRGSCIAGEITQEGCGSSLACCVPAGLSSGGAQAAEAVAKRDISMCSGLDESTAPYCRLLVTDAISRDMAMKYADAAYCLDINDLATKDGCLSDIALKTRNISLCSSISSAGIKDKCLIMFVSGSGDWQVCVEKVSRQLNKDLCFRQLAVATKNSEICRQISMESGAMNCMLAVELALASPSSIDCSILPQEECSGVKGCKPVLINDARELLKDVYAGCSRDAKFFCTQTGGRWAVQTHGIEISETCDCGNKAYYEGYGCFSCDSFNLAKYDCMKRLEANA